MSFGADGCLVSLFYTSGRRHDSFDQPLKSVNTPFFISKRAFIIESIYSSAFLSHFATKDHILACYLTGFACRDKSGPIRADGSMSARVYMSNARDMMRW